MLRPLLNRNEEALVLAEREVLQRLGVSLARLEASREDVARLDQARHQLDELFLLVIVGEFNAGKSAFINALLGERLLEEGATPTTVRVHILRHGDAVARHLAETDVEIITSPIDWLREINLVDTPGTNAVIQRHQEIAEDFVPRSDLVLFVTSADRPFSESERVFLNRIRKWGKKVVLVVNKVDILDEPDVATVQAFVAENAVNLLGVNPEIFLVSARLAQRAKGVGHRADPTAWAPSRFEPLESFIFDTLNEEERLRLKLLSPLGIAERLRANYAEVAANRLAVLADDFATLDVVESALAAFEEDMRRDFHHHLARIDNELYQMSDRGMRFIDETMRLNHILDLINSAKVREAFEREVIADTPQQIERRVSEMIDWLIDREYRQWQAVMGYLQDRAELHRDRVIGEVGGTFELNRRELLESVRRATERATSSYDHRAEAAKLADSLQQAVAQTALLEVGAVGLGAILIAALHTLVADVTGLLFAGTLAAVGLYILPNRRRRAREDLRTKVSELQVRLHEALSSQFEEELARSIQQMREAVEPYTRFVRIEREKLTSIAGELDAAGREMRNLEARVRAL